MYGAITLGQIADHRNRDAGIPGQILTEAERRRHHALIAGLYQFEPRVLWPIPVNARSQSGDAMHVQIKLDAFRRRSRVEQRPQLIERDGLTPTAKIQSRPPSPHHGSKSIAAS